MTPSARFPHKVSPSISPADTKKSSPAGIKPAGFLQNRVGIFRKPSRGLEKTGGGFPENRGDFPEKWGRIFQKWGEGFPKNRGGFFKNPPGVLALPGRPPGRR